MKYFIITWSYTHSAARAMADLAAFSQSVAQLLLIPQAWLIECGNNIIR